MTLGRVLLDSSVFIYAVGVEHRYREPCRRLVDALGHGRFPGETTVLVVQEVLHQRARRTGDRAGAIAVARDVADVCHVHEVTSADLQVALDLYGDVAELDAADALHAAVALNHGIVAIVSADRAFAEITDLEAVTPDEAAERL